MSIWWEAAAPKASLNSRGQVSLMTWQQLLLGIFPHKCPSWLQLSFLKPTTVILWFSLLPFPKPTPYHFMVVLHQVAFCHLHQHGPRNLPDSLVLSWIHLPAEDKVGKIPHFSFCTLDECSCSGRPQIWCPLMLYIYLKILIATIILLYKKALAIE